MSERTVKLYDCDLCGAENIPVPLGFHVQTDRRMDGAGSMENFYGVVWVCPLCATKLLQAQLKELDFRQAQEWLGQFKHWERR